MMCAERTPQPAARYLATFDRKFPEDAGRQTGNGDSFPSPERGTHRSAGSHKRPHGEENSMATILWIIAVILVVSGIFAIFRKQLLWGIVLIVVGLLVGPGGVSIFTKS
jgi:hypothetical protein